MKSVVARLRGEAPNIQIGQRNPKYKMFYEISRRSSQICPA